MKRLGISKLKSFGWSLNSRFSKAEQRDDVPRNPWTSRNGIGRKTMQSAGKRRRSWIQTVIPCCFLQRRGSWDCNRRGRQSHCRHYRRRKLSLTALKWQDSELGIGRRRVSTATPRRRTKNMKNSVKIELPRWLKRTAKYEGGFCRHTARELVVVLWQKAEATWVWRYILWPFAVFQGKVGTTCRFIFHWPDPPGPLGFHCGPTLPKLRG